jgi:hypothetical protein
MKSEFPISFIEDTRSSRHLMDSPEAVAKSIAHLMEENEALRRLAALLRAQLEFVRGSPTSPHQH